MNNIFKQFMHLFHREPHTTAEPPLCYIINPSDNSFAWSAISSIAEHAKVDKIISIEVKYTRDQKDNLEKFEP